MAEPQVRHSFRDTLESLWWVPAIGLVLLGFSYLVGEPALIHTILEHLGIAFLVAGIVGIAIDFRVRRELSFDVLRGTLRYLVPRDVVDEMLHLSRTE